MYKIFNQLKHSARNQPQYKDQRPIEVVLVMELLDFVAIDIPSQLPHTAEDIPHSVVITFQFSHFIDSVSTSETATHRTKHFFEQQVKSYGVPI